jgi:serine/threonine-protein kinase RsbW
MECCASCARLLGFPGDRVEDIKTAVSEACTNAIEHGNGRNPAAEVVVTARQEREDLVISVQDFGQGIPEVGRPSIDRKMEHAEPARGWGVFLVQELADRVDLNAEAEHGHVLRMAFRLPACGSRIRTKASAPRKER